MNYPCRVSRWLQLNTRNLYRLGPLWWIPHCLHVASGIYDIVPIISAVYEEIAIAPIPCLGVERVGSNQICLAEPAKPAEPETPPEYFVRKGRFKGLTGGVRARVLGLFCHLCFGFVLCVVALFHYCWRDYRRIRFPCLFASPYTL